MNGRASLLEPGKSQPQTSRHERGAHDPLPHERRPIARPASVHVTRTRTRARAAMNRVTAADALRAVLGSQPFVASVSDGLSEWSAGAHALAPSGRSP